MIPIASSKMSEVSPLDNSQLIVSSGAEELSQSVSNGRFLYVLEALIWSHPKNSLSARMY